MIQIDINTQSESKLTQITVFLIEKLDRMKPVIMDEDEEVWYLNDPCSSAIFQNLFEFEASKDKQWMIEGRRGGHRQKLWLSSKTSETQEIGGIYSVPTSNSNPFRVSSSKVKYSDLFPERDLVKIV